MSAANQAIRALMWKQIATVGWLIAVVLFGFLLAACSTPTVVRDRVVEVSVPIAVQPIKPADVPAVPTPLPPRPKELSAAADVLLSKVCEWVAFGLKADPLLRVSAGMRQEALAAYPECEGR